ncbi:MAG: hypothetical protein ACN6OP_18550 [Pseudomonadales bacterium]
MDPTPAGFVNDALSRLVRTEIQSANRALIRTLVTAAYAGDGFASEFVGTPRETLTLFAKATPTQLNTIYKLGFPVWDVELSTADLAKELKGEGTITRGPNALPQHALSQLVRAEIQETNKALIRALVAAATDGDTLLQAITGVSKQMLDLFAGARQSQLVPLIGTCRPLWAFRFSAPDLAKALLDGEIGTTAVTHRFLAGLGGRN